MYVSYLEVVLFVFMQVFFSCLRGELSVFIWDCSVFVKAFFVFRLCAIFDNKSNLLSFK